MVLPTIFQTQLTGVYTWFTLSYQHFLKLNFVCTQRAYVWQSKITIMTPAEAAHIIVCTREMFLPDVTKEALGDAVHDMITAEIKVIMDLLPNEVTDPADEGMVEAYAKEWADFAAHNFIVPMKRPPPCYGKATVMPRVGVEVAAVVKPNKAAKAAAEPVPVQKTTPRKKPRK